MSDALYRSPYPEPRENDEVCISREEYGSLLRSAEILDRMEDGVDIYYDAWRNRYRWQVDALGEYTDYGRTCEEGRGHTFVEAAEIAFGLPPVEPWWAPVPARRPWKRFVVVGVILTLGAQWGFPILMGVFQ